MEFNRLGNTEHSTSQLQPLTDEDMARYAADDVVDWYLRHGKNTSKIGEPMTDEQFRKFHGLPVNT